MIDLPCTVQKYVNDPAVAKVRVKPPVVFVLEFPTVASSKVTLWGLLPLHVHVTG